MKTKVLALLVLSVLFVIYGCSQGDDEDEIENGYGALHDRDYILQELTSGKYTAQSLPIPYDLGEVGNVTYNYHDDKIYFSATTYYIDADNAVLPRNDVDIYSVNIDGTGLTLLSEYRPYVAIPEDMGGWHYIQEMVFDSMNSLWLLEAWGNYTYNLPANTDINSVNSDELLETVTVHSIGNTVRKLDTKGSEQTSFDLGLLLLLNNNRFISSFFVDNNENIYISCTDAAMDSVIIYVTDNIGTIQFSLEDAGAFNRFIQMPDDYIAVHFYSQPHEEYQTLREIDVTARRFGETIRVPGSNMQVFAGNNAFDFIISDNSNMYGWSIGDTQAVHLLSWLDVNITDSGNIRDVFITPDWRIICTNNLLEYQTQASSIEILVLTITAHSDIPDKTALTLATIGSLPSHINDLVVGFNRTNMEYRIDVTDYSVYSTGDNSDAGLLRLTTEIASGKTPDMFYLSGIPYMRFANMGLFADVYPFIEADQELSISDFIEDAFRAFEIDGKLYQVFPEFFINTIVGHPSVVGSSTGWNMNELVDVIDKHPDGVLPIGIDLTKLNFLRTSIATSIEHYIDMDAGAVNFDTPDFIELLTLINRLPVNTDWTDTTYRVDDDFSVSQAVISGQQIALYSIISNIHSFKSVQSLFGGEIVFKGFPTVTRNGTVLHAADGFAICAYSQNQVAAWTFLRTLLDNNWQYDNLWFGFPSNRYSFERKISAFNDGKSGNDRATEEDIDKILDIVSVSSGINWLSDDVLWSIISESALDYFNGILDEQEAARIIQSKAAVYISEMS